MNITDIVLPINDFLLEPDIVSGGLYICKSGGAGLLAKSANKDNKYIIEKFFNYLMLVNPKEPYDKKYYYDGMELPPIMLDYLLDNDSPEVILDKVKTRINNNSKWMDRKGILALVDMTFDPEISFNYRKFNPMVRDLIDKLKTKYNIYFLDNCDKSISNKLGFDIFSSYKLKTIKCSEGTNYQIYKDFMEQTNINPNNILFVETLPGYIDSINNYAKQRGVNIKALLYNKETFIKDLSDILDISLNNIVGEFVCNNPKISQGELLSEIVIDNQLLNNRKGSVIVDNFIHNGKLYEKLIQDDGTIFCTVLYSDTDINKTERTIILPISHDKYKQIYHNFL